MKGKKQQIQIQVLQLVDSLLILLSFWLSRVVRDALATQLWTGDWIGARGAIGANLSDIFWILAIVVPFGPIVLEKYGFYEHPLQKRPWESLKQMFQSLLVMTVFIAIGVVFAQFEPSSRLTLGAAIPLAGILLLLREATTRRYLRDAAGKHSKLETVIFAGSMEDVRSMRDNLPKGVVSEWRVAEIFDLHQRPISELPGILHQHSVARVIFAAGHSYFDKVQEAVRACEVEGVEAWIYANFLQTSVARPTFDFLGNQPMLVFRTTPEISWALLTKAVLDRTIALATLIVLAIPMLLIALIIRISSPGPVIFKQARSGRHGKPFTMLKFRTMKIGAEEMLQEVKAMAGNEMSGPVFKLENDPRIIPAGKFLRKFSLDELPQLFNVLMGDMSIVGPRPLPTYEVEEFTDLAHRRRLSVKPGLTCLWQVRGRNAIKEFDDWVKLDLEYIDNWSLALDFSILLRTIPVVLTGSGAR